MEIKKRKMILVLGPSLDGRQGISAVEKLILDNLISDRFILKMVATHREGSSGTKILAFMVGIINYMLCLILYRPLIIYIHFSIGASFYRKSIIILIAKLFQKKIVIHAHTGEFDVFYHKSPAVVQKLIKYILQLVDIIIVLGEGERDFFEAISGQKKCRVIHNSVIFPKVIASLDIEPRVVSTMGSLGHRKGTYDLLEAIPFVLQEYPEVEFWLCGNGEIAKVQGIIENKKLERNVKLLGWISGRDKEEVFLRSTVFVLPSYHEGMPISILEAMSYGLPVLSTCVNAIPDLILNGENGILIDAGDTVGLATKMIMLLKEDLLRTKLGLAARSTVRDNFSIDAQCQNLEGLFASLI